MFEDKIQQVRKAETISYTGKIENIVGMSIEDKSTVSDAGL